MKRLVPLLIAFAPGLFAHAADPICDTVFEGPHPHQPGDLLIGHNWTNGIPSATNRGCIPDGPNGQMTVVGETADGSRGVAVAGPVGACCVGSTCESLTPVLCEQESGYVVPNVTHCNPILCQTGACCIEPDQCLDEMPFGMPMDEDACNSQGGTFVGAGDCTSALPCPYQSLPNGYELFELTNGLQPMNFRTPRINDCGEVVFASRSAASSSLLLEIMIADNGSTRPLTNDKQMDDFPRINNDGTIAWERWSDQGAMEIVLLRGTLESVLGPGNIGDLNDAAQVSAYLADEESCNYVSRLLFYDGENYQVLLDNGFSNQTSRLNVYGDLVWAQYDFPCEATCCDWTSMIGVLSNGLISFLPTSTFQPQAPQINDVQMILVFENGYFTAWQNMVELFSLEGGGGGLAINDTGEIALTSTNHSSTVYEVRLLQNERMHRLSPFADLENSIHNAACSINNMGEVVWVMYPNLQPFSSNGIRMLRKIRTGDVDLDLDVDRDDFAKFPLCYTGPGDFDRLCECRFLDIDHDRDVDDDDYALFLANYTGPMDDCDNNSSLDLDDILFGPALDCNRNGVPDSCDISGGGSPDVDENGIPDDCVYDIPKPIWREIFPFWTNRFLTLVPRKEWGSVALKVTLTSLHHVDPPYTGGPSNPFTAFEGETRWVGPPTLYHESTATAIPFWAARLQCTPHYQLWTGIDLLHVTGSEVVPSSEYHVAVQSIGCQGREMDCPWESSTVRIKTGRWGDLAEPLSPPSATVQPDVTDIGALVNKFRSAPGAPIKARALLAGAPANPFGEITHEVLNVDLGFSHIGACVDAFRGQPYPYTIKACP